MYTRTYNMSWVCLGRVLGVSWLCLGCVLGVSGCVLGVSWVCLGCVLGVSWVCLGCALGVSRFAAKTPPIGTLQYNKWGCLKDDDKARAIITKLLEDYLTPWSERCTKARNESESAKFTADSKLTTMYQRETLRALTRHSYLALMTIHQSVCVDKVLVTPRLLFKATAYLITSFYTNAVPSRSKEFETLETCVVLDFLKSIEAEHVEMDNYKTFKVFGVKGQWIHGAQRKALAIYLEILNAAPGVVSSDDPERKYFFQLHPVHVANCLRAVSRDYELKVPIKVNLMRKVYAKWARTGNTTDHKGVEGETAEALFEKVAYANKHSPEVARKIYATITPEEDALLSKHNFLRIMGVPVEFPSDADWKNVGPSLDMLMDPKKQHEDDDVDDEDASDVEDVAVAFAAFEEEEGTEEWSHVLAICDGTTDELETRVATALEAPPKPHPQVVPVSKKLHDARQGKVKQQRVGKANKKKENALRKRIVMKRRKATQMSDDMTDDANPAEKKTKGSALTAKAAGSARTRDTTQSNINEFFKVTIEPTPDAPDGLSTLDANALTHILTNGEQGSNTFLDDEKEFLVIELRRVQTLATRAPSAKQLRDIIARGRALGKLIDNLNMNDTQYADLVKRFVRKFLTAVEHCAGEP